VPVHFHWTVLLIVVAVVFFRDTQNLPGTLLGIAAYLAILVIHEVGHLVAARRMRCAVSAIHIYPILGVTEFDTPWSRFDHAVISWGGVVAQAIVAVPAILVTQFLGNTRFDSVNTVLAILGPLNLVIAAFNLVPLPRFDGEIAWFIFPEWIARFRNATRRKPSSWR
jgi:membrane-associated protease RseP (regulator of RpoE activity)